MTESMETLFCVGAIVLTLVFVLAYQYLKSEKDWKDDWK
jgi:hypothetical protein